MVFLDDDFKRQDRIVFVNECQMFCFIGSLVSPKGSGF
jgi:hypothetical protein